MQPLELSLDFFECGYEFEAPDPATMLMLAQKKEEQLNVTLIWGYSGAWKFLVAKLHSVLMERHVLLAPNMEVVKSRLGRGQAGVRYEECSRLAPLLEPGNSRTY